MLQKLRLILGQEPKRKAAVGLLFGLVVALCYATLIAAHPPEQQYLQVVIILVWSAWIFRKLADELSFGALHVPVSPIQFVFVWLFGACFVAAVGPIIILYTGFRDMWVLTKP